MVKTYKKLMSLIGCGLLASAFTLPLAAQSTAPSTTPSTAPGSDVNRDMNPDRDQTAPVTPSTPASPSSPSDQYNQSTQPSATTPESQPRNLDREKPADSSGQSGTMQDRSKDP